MFCDVILYVNVKGLAVGILYTEHRHTVSVGILYTEHRHAVSFPAYVCRPTVIQFCKEVLLICTYKVQI
jgi:hypothetical protein